MRNQIKALAIAGALALGGVALGTQANAATTFTDGNFSDSVSGPFTTYNGGTFGPWSVTGSVDLIGNYWQAPTGSVGSVDLDGSGVAGALAQTFTASAGAYNLSFYLSGNPDGGDPVKTLNVSIAGVNHTYTFDTNAAGTTKNAMGYVQYVLPFDVTTSGADNVTLTFASGDASNSSFGPAIGGILISAVPETATWAMMLVGLGGLGGALRFSRRARRAAFA